MYSQKAEMSESGAQSLKKLRQGDPGKYKTLIKILVKIIEKWIQDFTDNKLSSSYTYTYRKCQSVWFQGWHVSSHKPVALFWEDYWPSDLHQYIHSYFSKSFDLIPQYLLIEKLAQNEEHFLGKWYWTEVIAQRSLQIITQPQALNVMLWEKLANATHRYIIREYEVKEGKWFWTNDCHYDTLSTSHFHASRKMWNTAENLKESYKNYPRAGRQDPKIRVMQAGVFIDIYTE